MPTAKAKFKGDGAGTLIPDFSDKLKRTLRSYYPDPEAKSTAPWADPADAFVSDLLATATWAVSQLHWQSFDITKQEVRAERASMTRTLKTYLKAGNEAKDKLRRLSPDFDRQLGIEADPLGLADMIEEFMGRVEAARQIFQGHPTRKRPAEKQHRVAVEMTIRLLRALAEYKISTVATADPDLGNSSTAVKILKAIGDDIGLVRSTMTWRDIIVEAKRAAPDLQ